MPYDIEKDSRCPTDSPWAVLKESDRSIKGCHPSRERAERQRRALNAADERNGRTHNSTDVSHLCGDESDGL